MKIVVVVLCLLGVCVGMTPEYMKQFVNENKLKLVSVAKSGLQNVSLNCRVALKNKTKAFDAVKYLDNTGKPASGFLNGNTQWLGNFGSCLKMVSSHYCYTTVEVEINKMKVPVAWGLCVPEECSEADVALGMEAIVDELELLAEKFTKKNKTLIDLKPLGENRYAACFKENKYSTGVIITLTIIAIFLSLCGAGTIWDLIESLGSVHNSYENLLITNGQLVKQHENGFSPQLGSSADNAVLLNSNVMTPSIQINSPEKYGLLKKMFLSFSLIKNTDQILNTNVPSNSITCINGIRVISMFWVILGHTFLFALTSGTMDNSLDGLAVLQNFPFMAVSNALFSVDSFFFLSGLLVGYLGWRKMEKNDGNLPIFGFYFHRFWRLTPVYMFVILFYDKLNGFLGQGPVWFNMQTNPPCDKYWWTNLLYINNFYPNALGNECIGWSWYLANDMQFYIISPLILIAVYKWRWIGAAVSIGSLTTISIVVTAAIMYGYNLNALLISQLASPNRYTNNYTDDVYIKPYCRITPYLVGLFIGYLFHMKISIFSRHRIQSWIINVVGWFAAAFLAVLIVYGPYSAYKKNGEPFNRAENMMYGAFSRFIWGVALAWVVYACHNGYGGQVNRFLSASYWIPLSRLTYGAYLVHPIVLTALYAGFETPVHFTMKLIVFYFIGSTALAYGSSFILAVFIELPLSNLEKLVFKM